jgi:acetylornithine/N-succinyldiaminopimelate aminotransferase
VRAADLDFLRGLRALADQHGLLLMCDEVQCGYGRPGSFYAFEQAGITPDLVSSAKGIGGGFPLGATLVTEKVGRSLPAGSHGGTYNNNPLAMAVGNAALDLLLAELPVKTAAKLGADITGTSRNALYQAALDRQNNRR